MALEWYVVHTLSGQEQKVKNHLDFQTNLQGLKDRVSQVLIPIEKVSEVKGGVKKITKRKFFPGYILVQMELDDQIWYLIKDTPGIIGFVGSNEKPVPLLKEEIEDILMQMDEEREKVKPKVLFDKGETVKVNDGPFVNFTGVVDEVDPDRGKLRVNVSIFGRTTPVELEYWQLERT